MSDPTKTPEAQGAEPPKLDSSTRIGVPRPQALGLGQPAVAPQPVAPRPAPRMNSRPDLGGITRRRPETISFAPFEETTPNSENTVSLAPALAGLTSDIPDFTPVMDRSRQTPELTPRSLDRRHPKYGGADPLYDAVLSEITTLPDRNHALGQLEAQRARHRLSDAELGDPRSLRRNGDDQAGDTSLNRRDADATVVEHRGPRRREETAASPGRTKFESLTGVPQGLATVSTSRAHRIGNLFLNLGIGVVLLAAGALLLVFAFPWLPPNWANRLIPQRAAPSHLPVERGRAPAVASSAPSGGREVRALPQQPLGTPSADAGALGAAEDLARNPPGELTAQEVVRLATGEMARERAELEALGRDLEAHRRSPNAAMLDQVLKGVRQEPTAPDALLVLARWPNHQGTDWLWSVAHDRKLAETTQRLALRLLFIPEILAKATPALAVAVELTRESQFRDPERCEAIIPLLTRAKTDGDRRSLAVLGSLDIPRGCGPALKSDCYPCLRAGTILHRTIGFVSDRTAQITDP